jgi:acyl-CoA dehydrogenase
MNGEMNIADMLVEQLERLFSRNVTRALLAESESGAALGPIWKETVELGVTVALVGEEMSGAGLAWSDCEGVFRTLGTHVAPIPLGETMIGAWALASAGLAPPDGVIAILPKVLRLDADGRVGGEQELLPWADQADHLVAVLERDGTRFVGMLDAAQANRESIETIGRIPSARIRLDRVQPLQFAAAPTTIRHEGLLPHLACLRTCQIAGALNQVLALCVEYGNTRIQFGKPIGKFQAVQHMIAELASMTAATQAAGMFACRRIDSGDAEFGAAVAKIQSGKAATRGAEIAHQVFGAIGVTDEHMLHYFTRRLWQWRSEGGSNHYWAETLGRQLLARQGSDLWPVIAD